MTPVGRYDPDWVSGGARRPAWATPKTDLAIEALAVCGRKYFQGQTKHNSEFAIWDAQEQMASGATNESYLHKAWILNCMEWPRKQNVHGTKINFRALLALICNKDRMTDWKARNREQVLGERGKDIVDSFSTAAELARNKRSESLSDKR